MYLSYTNYSRKLVTNLSKIRHVQGCKYDTDSCTKNCLIILLISKKFFFSTNPAILTKSSSGIDFSSCLSNASGEMLRYNSTTLALTKIAFSGIDLGFLVFLIKSPGSLMHYQPFQCWILYLVKKLKTRLYKNYKIGNYRSS